MRNLEGRVALVTGAASGMGAATAVELASRGAMVALAEINDEGARAVADRITQAGGTAMALHLDIADDQEWGAALDQVVATWGGLDILHNNAAAVELTAKDAPIVSGDPAVWDRTSAVNLKGVMLGCKFAVPRMIERGGGVIINTSSTSALWGAASPAYAAAKAGVISVTQHVASQYGRDRIRCIAIAPGLIVAETTPAPQWFIDMLMRHQCLPQVGRPEDIARVVAFLASDDASFITGVLIPVDAGQTCHRPWMADEYDHAAAAELDDGSR